MMNNNTGILLPAEWSEQDAIMLVWPHKDTDWAYMLDDVIQCFQSIVKAITSQGEHVIIVANSVNDATIPADNDLVSVFECPTNDTWARDICPITTLCGNFTVINDFKFNGWGLKFAADKDNLITSSLFSQGIFSGIYVNLLSFVLEGGSIESDGNGVLLTTSECLLSKNRNGQLSKAKIENHLKANLGVRKILWLDYGYLSGDDTDSHIDTLARLAPGSTILYVATNNPADEHYESLKKMEAQLREFTDIENQKFHLVPLPLPRPIYDEAGFRLPATYANFLIGNGFVLVPTYGQEDNDSLALSIIAEAFPDRKIIGVDCQALIKQHGSLHCVTMQFPHKSIKL